MEHHFLKPTYPVLDEETTPAERRMGLLGTLAFAGIVLLNVGSVVAALATS
jgi:hypothetical protein